MPTVVARASRGRAGPGGEEQPLAHAEELPGPQPAAFQRRRTARAAPSRRTAPPASATPPRPRSPGGRPRRKWPWPSSTWVTRSRAISGSGAVEVGGAQHQAGADAVRRVHGADDAGVVDDRDQVRDPACPVSSPRSGRRRRRCTSTRRAAAGSPSGTPVVPPESWKTATSSGSMPGLDLLDGRARGRGRRRRPASRRRRYPASPSPRTSTCAQGRVVPLLLGGEPDQVEAARPASTRCATAPTRRLISPISWPRCAASVHTGTSPALSTPYQATIAAEPVGDLEQHRVARRQPEPGEAGGEHGRCARRARGRSAGRPARPPRAGRGCAAATAWNSSAIVRVPHRPGRPVAAHQSAG